MSEFSQLSTCSRTTDFSFVFNNDAFSDAVLVLLVQRPKGASISRRLISSVAQLWLSAAQVTASTVASTVAGAVPAGDALQTASRLLDKYGADAVSWLAPKEAQEMAIANVYQVNSALLAASSPYLRHLIQHPASGLAHVVPGLAHVTARNRGRKLVAVLVQPQHLLAAEAVVRFIFTNDIALTGGQEALHALLVAEQLAVPDCAEVCQHYLEDCAMDWGVALTLVHLQHKHQQEQHQQRQAQWQRLQAAQGGASGAAAASKAAAAASSVASTRRPPVYQRGGARRGGGGSAGALEAIAPLLPVPSESVYLQGLLLRAQDFLLRQFEDLELVLGSAEGRQQLLLLPYDALRAILQHPRLKVASENTALLAAAGWLAANAAQVSSLLLSPGPAGGPDGRTAAASMYNSALYNSNSTSAGQQAQPADGGDAANAAVAAADASTGDAPPPADGAAAQDVQQPQPPTASGVASLLLDLCQVLRLCQLSYTYAVHVLPHLPLFRDQPQLVSALQFEVLRYQAAGELRQRRLAAEAAAAAAAAACDAAPTTSLTSSALAGLDEQQQQAAGAAGAAAAASDSVAAASAAAADNGAANGGWPGGSLKSPKQPGADAAGWCGGVPPPGLQALPSGWRGDGCTDATLLQSRRRPESALSVLDFTFSFDPAGVASLKPRADGSGSVGASGGSAKGSAANGGTGGSGSAASGVGGGGVDLMQRLLGLAPQQAAAPDTLLSEDHFFAGYTWNMVVAADGFVGVSWRVVLPGGDDVTLGVPPPAAAGRAGVKLFGPDCAGFRSPEVAVTFSITSSGLSRTQRSSSGGFMTGTVFPAAANSGGSSNALSDGKVGAGSKGDAAGGKASGGNGASPPAAAAAAVAAKAAAGTAAAAAAAVAPGGSPIKGGAGGKSKVGRAYTEVQFVPAHCAWGFPEFAAAAGWDSLKGPDGKVVLRCQLRHRE